MKKSSTSQKKYRLKNGNNRILFTIRKFDVLIGGLTSIQINSTQFISTSVYSENAISICVRQAQLFPQWLNVFLIIADTQTWLSGYILLFCGIVLIFITSGAEEKKIDIWASMTLGIRVLCGSSTPYRPESFVFRLSYFSFLYGQLLIVTTYSAYYMTFVTRRIFEPQVSTIEEIVNLNYQVFTTDSTENYLSGYKLVSLSFCIILFLHLDNFGSKIVSPQNQFEAIRACGSIDNCLNRLQHENKVALLSSRQFIETSNIPNIYCFDRSQDLHTYFNVFLLRSDLFIFVEFSVVFERIITSGLIPKWVKDLRVPKQRIDDTETIEPFKLKNAIGPFSICCPALLLAFVAAIAEQIIYRQYSRNPDSRHWRLAHKLIDGTRYYFLFNWKQRVSLGNRRSLNKI